MKREKRIRIILAILGIILVGTGVAFNAAAALGNDPVGIVYDGIRSALNLSSEQLGMASNIVNIVLVVIIFFQSGLYTHPQVGRETSRQPAPQSSLSLSIFQCSDG